MNSNFNIMLMILIISLWKSTFYEHSNTVYSISFTFLCFLKFRARFKLVAYPKMISTIRKIE